MCGPEIQSNIIDRGIYAAYIFGWFWLLRFIGQSVRYNTTCVIDSVKIAEDALQQKIWKYPRVVLIVPLLYYT
jgi:hypothetical protein